MKKINILYWTFTGLFAFFMLGSAIPDVLMMHLAIKGIHTDLGYPLYFVPFIGVAKLLGGTVILLPGFARVKEWAYAGLFFDLIAAVYLVKSIGAPTLDWLPVLIPITIGIFSYIYHHKRLNAKLYSSRKPLFNINNELVL